MHRDEVELLINDVSVKNYGSQGQQRSSILALKLAEAKLLKSITGNNPVILLDDVMSELDVSRQDYILNHVKRASGIYYLLRYFQYPTPSAWRDIPCGGWQDSIINKEVCYVYSFRGRYRGKTGEYCRDF